MIVPCFLCGSELTVRTDKNGKFYLVCEPCGSQHFIRRQQGKERLTELGHYFYEHKAKLGAHMESLLLVQARLREIDALNKEIARLGIEAGIIFRDEDKLRARDALQKRVEFLLAELEQGTEDPD
jgi:hypothetical protein